MISAVLDRLSRLHPTVIDLSLDRVRRLLAVVGDPHDRLPPVVHVAGTNGKGSTIATLRALVEAAGLRVHVYTSPHLVRFAERIRIAGTLPDDSTLEALLEDVEAANADGSITFFEATTIAALLAFARAPADLCVLETGMGGRLDATNVVAHPALTIITPVALDHQSYLGDTLAAIAGEKAGILKPETPCILAAQADEARTVIEARAAALGVPLIVEGRDFSAETAPDGSLLFHGRFGRLSLPAPVLPGSFQRQNAAVALAAAEHLALAARPQILPAFTRDRLAVGLGAVEWPARLQRLHTGRLVERLPPGWEIWLDGGHNPHAAQALAQHLDQWHDRPIGAVMGLLSTKDADGVLRPLSAHIAALRTVSIPGEPLSLSAEDTLAAARHAGFGDSETAPSVIAALDDLAAGLPGPARILICGSLYLAGTVLAENG
ncbi:bifunctional folylpolyglutamate synthase/dihydrofolate synthase [Magnetospirillum molischianum]|uniref:Dihydrofolate synthase/folylpolyglutamate synthase n=1 Tax=Magnetospirillum molischianum DSM 120 TaxID=1150626 RepID=H8FRV8_MAGML|nr:folylpolyglutamate synthase/dihydrofolate synthase family protein [Magnetospirillum molischianum]CCG41096.1 putative folC bifunctional protein (Includes: Folylpolyglutamate synthase (Folylpoly-gamma-glutamate synthetase) (FPGS) (Tetrahydrofolate synthase) (Tetrahydrofolylpolyglutamate synthase); Dihydrofolate synthase) [Magnetospirillum molischianum DSM 120]